MHNEGPRPRRAVTPLVLRIRRSSRADDGARGEEGYSIARVRLSGHGTDLDALATELKSFKIAEAETNVGGRRTLTATSPRPMAHLAPWCSSWTARTRRWR